MSEVIHIYNTYKSQDGTIGITISKENLGNCKLFVVVTYHEHANDGVGKNYVLADNGSELLLNYYYQCNEGYISTLIINHTGDNDLVFYVTASDSSGTVGHRIHVYGIK